MHSDLQDVLALRKALGKGYQTAVPTDSIRKNLPGKIWIKIGQNIRSAKPYATLTRIKRFERPDARLKADNKRDIFGASNY